MPYLSLALGANSPGGEIVEGSTVYFECNIQVSRIQCTMLRCLSTAATSGSVLTNGQCFFKLNFYANCAKDRANNSHTVQLTLIFIGELLDLSRAMRAACLLLAIVTASFRLQHQHTEPKHCIVGSAAYARAQ